MTASDWLVFVCLCLRGRFGFAMSEIASQSWGKKGLMMLLAWFGVLVLGDKIQQHSHVMF